MSLAARGGTLFVVALLAGCGKTGDLYLPDRGGEVITRPTPTPPAEGAGTSGPAQSGEQADEEAEKKKQQNGATPPPKPQQ